jgi:hypothetical protein
MMTYRGHIEHAAEVATANLADVDVDAVATRKKRRAYVG